MINDFIKLDSSDEKRILDTLDFLNKHPETGYKEVLSSEYTANQFKELGYEPIMAGDIPGFYVKIDTGRPGPCVLVFGELDAIKCATHPEANPETGAVHSCGHSAQTAALVGIAAGLKKPGALDDLSGSIILCAVPAEEMIERDYRDTLIEKGIIKYYGGKPEFMRRGYFDGVDISFMVHTTSAPTPACRAGSVGIVAKKVIYKGKASHAGGSPQNGINALYAANLGLMAVNSIRETFTENELVRVHPIITNGGTVVNGIPDVVEIESYVRAKDYDAMSRSNKKVNRAFVGAAISIGANVEIIDAPGYAPLRNDKNMIDLAGKAAKIAYPDMNFDYKEIYGTGSTDMGDISLLFPSVHPYAPGATGVSHGNNYYITYPDLACVKCAQWQLAMLYILLSDGAKEGIRIKNEFEPMFKSKEEYFEYIEQFYSSGNRIEYAEGKAEAKI
ncbi:MAG: amidohydrolase [Clostridia bacterium]|nr:amidohydrolase [Clostridia bacterium]